MISLSGCQVRFDLQPVYTACSPAARLRRFFAVECRRDLTYIFTVIRPTVVAGSVVPSTAREALHLLIPGVLRALTNTFNRELVG